MSKCKFKMYINLHILFEIVIMIYYIILMIINYVWVSKYELKNLGLIEMFQEWKVRMIKFTRVRLAQGIDPHIKIVHIKAEGCVLF